ncbi:MAG: Hypoxanthine-guanine phosphoribosyltransferase [Rhodocyclaceae bacterium]|nr:Hypoxanthine-guanine phosphoribosyltransferase [Rhodocyclaceae bacterium]
MTPAAAQALLTEAELIHSADAIEQALARLAQDINERIGGLNPLVLCVMGGAVVFAGSLLPRLGFPLEFDYVHVSRYGDATAGGALRWIATPHAEVAGRTILLLDDILDEGVTLAAIRERLSALGASAVYAAVLAEKCLDRPKPARAEFVGLTVPDRYVFGFGMDVQGAWRNLPAIYALPKKIHPNP